jgi:hypothetical protein
MRETAYRFYVADELFYSAHNKMHAQRLSDLLNPKPTDERTAEEIVADVSKRAGLEIKDESVRTFCDSPA